MNLLFCTALVDSAQAWSERYRPWVEHHRDRLDADAIFIIDDGGSHVPGDADVAVVTVPPDAPTRALRFSRLVAQFRGGHRARPPP